MLFRSDVVMRDPHARSGTPVNPSQFRGRGQPVEYVSWDEVQVFLRRMNVRDAKHVYRLPTEAQWEYACRAGAVEDRSGNPDNSWLERNADGHTLPVGERKSRSASGTHRKGCRNQASQLQAHQVEILDQTRYVNPAQPATV